MIYNDIIQTFVTWKVSVYMIDKKIIDPRLDSVIADHLDKQLINSKPIIRWRVHFLNKSKQSIKPKPVQFLH